MILRRHDSGAKGELNAPILEGEKKSNGGGEEKLFALRFLDRWKKKWRPLPHR